MLPGIKVVLMKSKGLVIKSLVLSAFSKKLGACQSAPGRIPADCGLCQAVYLLVLTLAFSFIFPVSLLSAGETGALLEQIRFDRESNSRETVTFRLNGPYFPKIFAMKGEAPKVVFDFYDTRHSTSIKSVMKSRGNLVSAIRVGMHKEPQLKTRVVLDMVPGGDYDFAQDFQVKDNTLKITIFHVGQTEEQALPATTKTKKEAVIPAKAPAPLEPVEKEADSLPQVKEKQADPPSVALPVVAVKTPPASSSQVMIKRISFEQSPDKGEKVVFELNNFHPPVVFANEEGTPSIVCDFMDSRLGDEVPEIIAAQGEFVTQVRVEKGADPPKIRVVLELVPNRHYDLQQVFFKEQNRYVLFVNSSDTKDAGISGKP